MQAFFPAIDIGFYHQCITTFGNRNPSPIFLVILIMPQYMRKPKDKYGRIISVFLPVLIIINGFMKLIGPFHESELLAYLLTVFICMIHAQCAIKVIA